MRGNTFLSGREIVLAVCGSIAAVESVKLARALRRGGATVQAVMTAAACGIVGPEALTYATGRPAITGISGLVEHVRHCGEDGSADLLLVAPATANTICKIAAGIDDTPVTTFATTAIGRGMPVVVAPAMHESMYRHPAVRHALSLLSEWGIVVAEPRIEEGRAKIAGTEEIVLLCERELSGKPLAGRHVLVTSGPCRERVDDVRILSTRSSGRMGRALAIHAFRLGARVTVVHGDRIPLVRNVHAIDAAAMREEVRRICATDPPDLFVSAAAVSDFAPEPFDGKIPSGKPVTITLYPLPKIIREVAEEFGIPCVAFKLGRDAASQGGEMLGGQIGVVVANEPEAMGSEEARVTILTRDGSARQVAGRKDAIAAEILSDAIRVFSLSRG